MNTFREAVMEALDHYYQESGGDTPDHMLVSESFYNQLAEQNRLEMLADKDGRETDIEGFMGVRVWSNSRMENTRYLAILISDDEFWSVIPQAKDFYDQDT